LVKLAQYSQNQAKNSPIGPNLFISTPWVSLYLYYYAALLLLLLNYKKAPKYGGLSIMKKYIVGLVVRKI
jgi:hypothetical protein